MAEDQRKSKHSPLGSLVFTFGGIAGCVAKTAVGPLERARIIAQTGCFQGTMRDLYRHILKKEGVLGLWRGNAINCMRQFPSKSILFWANDFWQDRFRMLLGLNATAALPFSVTFASGSLAGSCATFLTYPMDVLRTKLSVTANVPTGSTPGGAIDVARSTLAKEGVRGFYKGVYPSLLGVVPYEGIKFSVFNQAKQFVRSNFVDNSAEKIPMQWSVACGALAGIAAGGIMFPNDTVRRILQVSTEESYRGVNGFMTCYRDTYMSGGVARFYRGIGPYMVRMAPGSAIQFAVFDGLKNFFL